MGARTLIGSRAFRRLLPGPDGFCVGAAGVRTTPPKRKIAFRRVARRGTGLLPKQSLQERTCPPREVLGTAFGKLTQGDFARRLNGQACAGNARDTGGGGSRLQGTSGPMKIPLGTPSPRFSEITPKENHGDRHYLSSTGHCGCAQANRVAIRRRCATEGRASDFADFCYEAQFKLVDQRRSSTAGLARQRGHLFSPGDYF